MRLPAPEDPFWLRFEAHVWRGPQTGCAIWTGARNERGYGRVRVNGRMEQAHRVAFLRGGGILAPDRPHVLHRCDCTACVEFTCLFAGSNADNAADKARKNRGNRGRLGMPYGVQPSRRGGHYDAQISVGGKTKFLGAYRTLEEAAAVARAAKDRLYGA